MKTHRRAFSESKMTRNYLKLSVSEVNEHNLETRRLLVDFIKQRQLVYLKKHSRF